MRIHPVWKNKILYVDSLKAQEQLKELCVNDKQGSAIGFECPTTITLGLRGGDEDLLLSREEYQQKNIPIVSIKRGGQATLHSPGQLVLYPVVNIKKNKMRARDFVTLIERITQQTLLDLGIQTHKEEGQAGLFTKKGKIAFFGLHITEGVSQHGLAINVCNDLDLFSYIRSCGVARRSHDRVSFYHTSITVKQVFDLWIKQALGYSSVG